MTIEKEKIYPLTDQDIEELLKPKYLEDEKEWTCVYSQKSIRLATDFLRAVRKSIPGEEAEESLALKAKISESIFQYVQSYSDDALMLWHDDGGMKKISFAFLQASDWDGKKAFKLWNELHRILETEPDTHRFQELIR